MQVWCTFLQNCIFQKISFLFIDSSEIFGKASILFSTHHMHFMICSGSRFFLQYCSSFCRQHRLKIYTSIYRSFRDNRFCFPCTLKSTWNIRYEIRFRSNLVLGGTLIPVIWIISSRKSKLDLIVLKTKLSLRTKVFILSWLMHQVKHIFINCDNSWSDFFGGGGYMITNITVLSDDNKPCNSFMITKKYSDFICFRLIQVKTDTYVFWRLEIGFVEQDVSLSLIPDQQTQYSSIIEHILSPGEYSKINRYSIPWPLNNKKSIKSVFLNHWTNIPR